MPTSSEPGKTWPGHPGSRWSKLATAGLAPAELPRDRAEFEAWRARVIAAVRRIAQPPAGSLGVTSTLQATDIAGDLTRELHAIRADGGDPVLVVACYQADGAPRQSAPRRPAVLVCPGRNAVVGQVTGAQPPDYPDRNVAEQLARAGFLAVTMDYGLDGQLDPALLAGRDEAGLIAQLLAIGGQPLLGVLAGDALTALAWLGTHPAAAPGRTALFGHSLGGAVALHAGLLADRPLPVCVASHLGSYRVLGYGHPAGALPGITRHADLPDLFGALAPAPLQVQYGTRDAALDPADAAAAGQRISELYAAAGAPGQAEVLAVPIGHGTAIEPAIGFLRRALDQANQSPPARPPIVPPIRIGFDARMRAQIAGTVEQALGSGTLTLGPAVHLLERGLAKLIGQPLVTVDSGSSALEVALRDMGVAGRVVLSPVNTFIATAAAAIRAGATVDFVDLEPTWLGLSPDSLREALDRHGDAVAAVITMHTGGIIDPGLDQVIKECHERGVGVIEDAAHALGSALGTRPAGTIADYGAYSFYPTKVLTTGEGGAVTAAQAARLDAFRQLRDHGRTGPGATTHDCLGSNWRLSELHAAVGLAQLDAFTARTKARALLAKRYDALLSDLPGLRVQQVPPGSATSWYKYIAYLPAGTDRSALKGRLRAAHGVTLAGEVYDLPLSDQPYFAAGFRGREFPHARQFAARHVCLPLYPELTCAEQDRVVQALRAELC